MREHGKDGIRWLAFQALGRAEGVVHAVSARHGGVSPPPYHTLNLGLGSGDTPERVRANQAILARALGLDTERLTRQRQVHGADVAVIRRAADFPPGGFLGDYDALVTDVPGVALVVRVADCVPVLLYDPARRAAGAVHAGWRGTVAGAVRAAVRAMEEAFGTRPGDLLAGVGPAIGPCCYEVDTPVIQAVRRTFGEAAADLLRPVDAAHAHLDLWEANRRLLLAAGIPAERIEVAGLCTACRTDLFYSHRREGPATGRFAGVIALR
ncbi:MAG TPA: peptidoglycan editing factor PgeF [Dehalococcoidia bacterium]